MLGGACSGIADLYQYTYELERGGWLARSILSESFEKQGQREESKRGR
jgi:hypothetical protein